MAVVYNLCVLNNWSNSNYKTGVNSPATLRKLTAIENRSPSSAVGYKDISNQEWRTRQYIY